MNESNRQRLLKRDYKALEFEAMVLYIKHGLSAIEISEKLNLSLPTIQKWNKAGRWKELRPNMDALTEYKAASLYIEKGKTTGEIAQLLNVSEFHVKMWIDINGWDAAKTVSQSQDLTADLLALFCSFAKGKFPKIAVEIELSHTWYMESIRTKI